MDLCKFNIADVLRGTGEVYEKSSKLEATLCCTAVNHIVPSGGSLEKIQSTLVAHMMTLLSRTCGGDAVALAKSLRLLLPKCDWTTIPESPAPRSLQRRSSTESVGGAEGDGEEAVNLDDLDFLLDPLFEADAPAVPLQVLMPAVEVEVLAIVGVIEYRRVNADSLAKFCYIVKAGGTMIQVQESAAGRAAH
jgi:hypothetical protein